MKMPIRYKLLSLILIVTLPVILISTHHYHVMVEDAKSEILIHNREVASNIAADLNLIVQRSLIMLRVLAEHPAVVGQESRTCDALFRELLPLFPDHLNVIAVDMSGRSFGSAVDPDRVRRIRYQDREWFRRALHGKPYFGNKETSKLFARPAAMATEPVFDKGRQNGVLGISLDLEKVRIRLAGQRKLPPDSISNIVDEKGNVVICICADDAGQEQSEACPTIRLAPGGNFTSLEETGSDGKRRLFNSASVPGTGWQVLIGVPSDIATQQASRSARQFLAVVLAGTLVAVILALMISRRISKNVERLVDGMKAVEQGNLEVQLPAEGYDELSLVARSFNEMLQHRLRDEERLKRSESFLASVLDGIGEGVTVIDREYRIVSANDGYARQVKLRRDETVGRHCYELSHQRKTPCFKGGDGCDCAVHRCFETGEPHRAIHLHRDATGKGLYLEVRAYPLRDATGAVTAAIETLTDISERRSLEAQLFQAQKMEAVGLLAGGVAHDFNNILTAIMGYGNLLKRRSAKDETSSVYADHILAAADRASRLTRSLLAFSRTQMIEPRPIRLNEVIERMEPLIRRLVGEDLDLVMTLTGEAGTVWADPHQMEQVLMNLCTNARDAMPDGGALTITTESVVVDESFCRRHPAAAAGRYMRLSVVDNGTGMDEETKEKIFEPFFTTKEMGKGTGLGLSIIYGIIKQHNGFIELETERGRGSRFLIYLPVIHAEAQALEEPENAPAARGTETILLADDDSNVRQLARIVLQDHGYQVICAADGRDAVEKFAHQPVDLVIVDALMPRMNGKEVYEELKKRAPEIKVLFISGYAPEIVRGKGIVATDVAFLHKPFIPSSLLAKVREVLG